MHFFIWLVLSLLLLPFAKIWAFDQPKRLALLGIIDAVAFVLIVIVSPNFFTFESKKQKILKQTCGIIKYHSKKQVKRSSYYLHYIHISIDGTKIPRKFIHNPSDTKLANAEINTRICFTYELYGNSYFVREYKLTYSN